MAQYVRITGFPETPEDVFGMTIRGLLAQGVPSIITQEYPYRPMSMYRSIRDGVQVACGAGLWIADKDYHPDMEGRPYSVIAYRFGDKWNRPFLRAAISKMQNIHDESAQVWIKQSSGDWSSILHQGASEVISRLSEISKNVLIPTHWEEFFVPE